MRQLLLLALLALTLSACLQPSTPTATPSSAATASAAPSAIASATTAPSSIPSVTPTTPSATLPVASPASNAPASSAPTLAQAAQRLEPVLNDVFNVSRTTKHQDTAFSQVEPDVWTMGDVQGDYLYSISLSHARTRWRPEELLEMATNASGVQNGFLSYSVGGSDKANIMKCYGQRYEFNLNLKSYSRAWSVEDYQPLMRRIMGRLIDACPL